jgi:DNA polymerase I-like protein with 3'-5' exonuclease and polymerase domains
MGRFNPTSLLVCDTETTGLRPFHGDAPFAVSLCDQDGNTFYTEWRVDPFSRRVLPDDKDVDYLRRLLGKRKLPKIFFNAPFDFRMLREVGIDVAGPIHDVGVAARICFTLEFSYKLKELAAKYGICGKEDEKRLKDEVNRCRTIGRKRGYNLAEDTEADYWLPRVIDPNSDHCEEYAVKDVFPRTLMLWLMYTEVVMGEEAPELRETYDFEMGELWYTLREMEDRGIRIHRDRNGERLAEAHVKRERYLTQLQERLIRDGKQWLDLSNPKLKGKKREAPFNPGSPLQLARVLYEPKPRGYGLEVHRRSEKPPHNPSTDWKALREHLTEPVVQDLVKYRSADKEVSTYFGAYANLMLPDRIDKGSWCLHPNFNQLGANKTSRTSSNDPNFQNVGDANNNPNSPSPIQVRDVFGPRNGKVWGCFDWSGQEMRIFADVAKIETMLTAFREGRSIHEHNANLAWGGKGNPHALIAAGYSLELGTPSSLVTSRKVLEVWKEIGWNDTKARIAGIDSEAGREAADRWLSRFGYDIIKAEASIGLKRAKTRAKNLGFAKIYGAGVNGVIDMLYCTRREAREMLDRFDEVHPGMPEFMYDFSAMAKAQGYIHNLFGRRLHVDPYTPYKAVNYLVQGTAADMLKRAMVAVAKYLKGTGLDAHLVAPVHDEIIIEIAAKHSFKWLLRGIVITMEAIRPPGLRIAMPVECSLVRRYWHEKEEVKL